MTQIDSSTDRTSEMKPVKQNVTYDSSTGKMYEELGSTSSSTGSAAPGVTGVTGVSGVPGARSSYFQNYQASYPYSGMQPPQYMSSSYTSPSYVGPYDRLVLYISVIRRIC